MAAAGKPDLHIVARFLDRMADGSSFSRSRLQRAVGLNYDLFRKYLAILEVRGLVAALDDSQDLVLTPKGHKTRTELLAWLNGLFGGRL